MVGALFDAVLFDRDGTLVEDVPYNGDPSRVHLTRGAREAVDRLRAAGLRIGLVTNQSGLATGRFSADDLARVNARVAELVGGLDTVQVCPHAPGDGCRCRKPAPALVQQAARALRTTPDRCVVVGDTGADMGAALAAGAAGVLVPTPATRPAETAAAPAVAGDLPGAVELVLRRQRLVTGRPRSTGDGVRRRRVLVARPDAAGDVLLTGPAVRAVAAAADEVVMLCGPRGRAAAALLPGVDRIVEHPLPWIEPDPAPVDPAAVGDLVADLAALAVEEALIFTSFHQSPLPLALLLRLAGVPRISAISDDYPGSLLDLRHRVPAGMPEPERALSLATAAGYPPVAGQVRLALRPDRPTVTPPDDPGYVVVHPGASAPARAAPETHARRIVAALAAAGHPVVVTGGRGERDLTARVAGADAVDLGGVTDLAQLAGVLEHAGCLVAGNTGPAHLAAAVGTPVVSLFAPTVSFGQWQPYRVPCVRLGDPTAACRHTRAVHCPTPGHPCLASVEPAQVVAAVELLRNTG